MEYPLLQHSPVGPVGMHKLGISMAERRQDPSFPSIRFSAITRRSIINMSGVNEILSST